MAKEKTDMIKLLKPIAFCLITATIIAAGCRRAKADETMATQALQEVSLKGLEIVSYPIGMPAVEKEYHGFNVNFNPKNRTPNYVVWTLHGDETEGASSRSNKFWTDNEVKGCASTRDYSRSGYDRGHMCPAGEQKWSDEAMHDSFVMTNICPQKHELNSGAWKTLEEKERGWARRDKSLVIVAGPIYDADSDETIGTGKVRVPSAFFKVILAPMAEPMRAIGFVYPNMKCPGNMSNYAATVDEVERITGLDFFPILPDDIENRIESSMSYKEWNSNKKAHGNDRVK